METRNKALREVQNMKNVKHPFIIKIIDVFENDEASIGII
jgi:serine/threonine protein kinase